VSTNELVTAYQAGQLSRRRFVRGLVAAGVTLTTAAAYADLLSPDGAGAAVLRGQSDFYDTTTTTQASTTTTTQGTTTTTQASTTTTTQGSTTTTTGSTSTTSGATTTTAGTSQGQGQVSDNTVAPGGTTVFSGGGFGANQSLALELQSTPQSLGSTTSDGNGSFSVTVTIPANATPGSHSLVARGAGAGGGTREVVAGITVTGTLPATGSEIAELSLLGVATVALGRAVSGIRRMLRDEQPPTPLL
jgi:hypothetical protein